MSLKRWGLDSCDCVIIYEDSNFTFSSWERRCNEHRALDGQRLYDGIAAHNKSFNDQYSVPPTPTREELKTESNRITQLKISERDRILRAGSSETR